MPDLLIGGGNCFVVNCLKVCTCVLVHTVFDDAGATGVPGLDIRSCGALKEPVFGVSNGQQSTG